MALKYCPNCGAEIFGDANFCYNCKTNLETFRNAQEAQERLANMNAVVVNHAYSDAVEFYRLAQDVIRKEKIFVNDATFEEALFQREIFSKSIVTCMIVVFAYDERKVSENIVSRRLRDDFEQMGEAFELAAKILTAGLLRHKLRKSDREVLVKISNYKSNETLKELYHNSVDFDIMLHNCQYLLDAAEELEFDLSFDAALNDYVKQIKKILYDIRGRKEVDELLTSDGHKDVARAFKALYNEDDPIKAKNLFELAAITGKDGEAMYQLGELYRHSWSHCIHAELFGGKARHPVAQDDDKTLEWYRKAADANYARAMEALGGLYESGDIVAKDINTAIYWYKKAASLGCSGAMGNLARIYQEGRSVTKNTAEARRWRDMQTFDGYREGIKNLQAELRSGKITTSAPEQTATWIKTSESEPTASWMKTSEPAKIVAPSTEKKFSVTENASKTSSADNTSNEFKREDYPGIAFWLCLIGVYCFTSAGFFESLFAASIFGLVVYILTR